MERRAVVPANGWFEWMTTPKEKFRGIIKEAMGSWRFFAAVWERWQRMKAGHCIRLRCLTQEANEDCSDVHNRMPVLISDTTMEGWFDERYAPTAHTKGDDHRHPVRAVINRPGINHPGLVEPLRTLFDQEYGV